MLHRRILIGFLNAPFSNTIKKIRHLKDILFVYSYPVYLICRTNKKNVLQKEIKNLTFEVSSLSIHLFYFFPIRYQTFMTSTQRGMGRSWNLSRVYRFYCFQTTYLLFIFADREGWVFCEGHNCMIPNIKTYSDKKVRFLALMPVLQWNGHPRFLIYVRSKWKVA